jgi:ATP-dependent Lhr-like helicase
MGEVRTDFPWIAHDATSIVRNSNGEIRWWTFGGGIANALLADYLRVRTVAVADNLAIKFPDASSLDTVAELISAISLEEVRPVPNANAIDNMKFTECLSPELAAEVFCARFNDAEAIRKIVVEPKRVVVEH